MEDPATVAICVGHSRRLANGHAEGGAVSIDGKWNEWKFNDFLSRQIAAELYDRHDIAAFLVNDYGERSYSQAMAWLARELRGLGNIRLAIELHFNAAETPSANGHEWLHYPGSQKGKLFATELHLSMVRSFPGLRARGVKPPVNGRGSEFLKLTHCPAVIAEPFFGSNAHDWDLALAHTDRLAATIAQGIANYHKRAGIITV